MMAHPVDGHRLPPVNPHPGRYLCHGVLMPRRMLWALRKAALRCPYGHQVYEHGLVLAHSGIRCQATHDGRDCGALLWVLAVHLSSDGELEADGKRRRFFFADATIDELRQFGRMTDDEILKYLGAAI